MYGLDSFFHFSIFSLFVTFIGNRSPGIMEMFSEFDANGVYALFIKELNAELLVILLAVERN